MPEGVYFLAKLAGTREAAVCPMNTLGSTMVPMRTRAVKSSEGGKKGDASQMVWVHWRGNFGEMSILSIGFFEKNFRAFFGEISTHHQAKTSTKDRHDSKVGGASSSLSVSISIWGRYVSRHKENRMLWLWFPCRSQSCAVLCDNVLGECFLFCLRFEGSKMPPPLCQIVFSQIFAEIDTLDARINELYNRLEGQF